MGYLFAALAVVAGAVKGFCGKKTSGYANSLKDAVLFNTVRMILCVLIGLGVTVAANGLGALAVSGKDVLSIGMSGIFSAVFVVSWLILVKNGAYLMLDVFLMLGVAVPLMGSQIFYSEYVQPKQWLGLGILVAAALILCSYNNKIKAKMKPGYLLLLILCGVACGLSDFSQKMFVKGGSGTPVATFQFYSYLISFACLGIFCFAVPKGEGKAPGHKLPKALFVYILLMSGCLFLNSFFQTLAATRLSSAQLFPMTKGLSLILSVTMASVFFGEKVNLKCVLGVALAFAGILVINL